MTFGPVEAKIDLVALEQRSLELWRDEKLFEQISIRRRDCEPWVFYEGPPTANGRPGLHHVWARVFKDLFIRFQTMRGHRVPRRGGWDCHGLPVEIEVEKKLGFSGKHDIEAFGIAKFNDECRKSVQRYVADFAALTERAAVSIDSKDAYWTLSNEYIESVWWLVRQLWDQNLLYESHRVSPYCPRCGTALSSHELGQPGAYRDVVDKSVYVRFPVVATNDPDSGTADLLVWTTTPWTLLSNTGVAVGADIDYVQIKDPEGGRDLIAAAATVADDAEIVRHYRGAELVGWRYRRPFDLLPIDSTGERVVAGAFVNTDEGSGMVHLAPAFGADDMDVAQVEGLPVINPVNAQGTFDSGVGPWAGRFVKDVDAEVVADLEARRLLVREEPYLHAYPHCWRCGTPLIYWAKTSWFVRTSERKNDLLAQNEVIGWHPEHIRRGRFGDWLSHNVDWALSRDRYWGTPLPVWRCADAHDTCVGSVAELATLCGSDLSELDLHRPHVDEITFRCPSEGCDQLARRLAPVLDAWFDSGSMPSAQHHHPFDGGQAFEATFPADFICEAIDQTRGWFYSLLAVNTLVFGSTPYRNVVCLAHVVDQDGQKMSKSKGNVIDPWHVFDKFGSDALRWYFFSAGSAWTNRRVYEDGITEATRKTLLTLWNMFSFFATYADIEGWVPLPDGEGTAPAHVLDRWALAELDDTVAGVTAGLEGFDALAGADRLARFVDDLSNWYVRRSRSRFWGSIEPADTDAFATLHRCLKVSAQLLAPFCPFLADALYRGLDPTDTPESVHLSDWPAVRAERGDDAAGSDDDLASAMASARRLVALGRAARSDAKVRVRQPLRRGLVLHPGADLPDDIRREVAQELNVKEIEDVATLSSLISWDVVPNYRALGPRLGARVGEIKSALASADGSEIVNALEENGWVEVAQCRLTRDDVEVRATNHQDFALAQDNGWAVALDLDLDEGLRAEGDARELVRALNDLRKELDLALTDRVELYILAPTAMAAALHAHSSWLAGEVLASVLEVVDQAFVDDLESDYAGWGRHNLKVGPHQVDVVIRPSMPAS